MLCKYSKNHVIGNVQGMGKELVIPMYLFQSFHPLWGSLSPCTQQGSFSMPLLPSFTLFGILIFLKIKNSLWQFWGKVPVHPTTHPRVLGWSSLSAQFVMASYIWGHPWICQVSISLSQGEVVLFKK